MIVSHLNCSWRPYIKIFCHIHVWKATFQILGNIWSQSSTRFEIIRLLTPSLRKVFHMIRPHKPRSVCHSKCSQSRQHISRRRSRQWKERRRWLSRTFWGVFLEGSEVMPLWISRNNWIDFVNALQVLYMPHSQKAGFSKPVMHFLLIYVCVNYTFCFVFIEHHRCIDRVSRNRKIFFFIERKVKGLLERGLQSV